MPLPRPELEERVKFNQWSILESVEDHSREYSKRVKEVEGVLLARFFHSFGHHFWSSQAKGRASSQTKEPSQEPSSHHHTITHGTRPTNPPPDTITSIYHHRQQLKIKGGWLTQNSLFRKLYCASHPQGSVRPKTTQQTLLQLSCSRFQMPFSALKGTRSEKIGCVLQSKKINKENVLGATCVFLIN